MSFLEIFKYTRQDSIVHRLDPRAKLILSAVLGIISLMFLEIIPLIIIILFLLPLLGAAKSLVRWAKNIKGLAALVLFIMIFNTLFSTEAYPFSRSVALALRLLAMMTSFSFFFLTVHPDELSQALIKLHVKYEFALAVSMAMRYVPTLGQDAYAIMDAQKSRGVELDKGNLLKRIRNIVPIIVPLIVVAIRRALSISESMESRGFGANGRRTYMEMIEFKRNDWIVVFFSLIGLVIILLVRFWWGLPNWMLWQFPF